MADQAGALTGGTAVEPAREQRTVARRWAPSKYRLVGWASVLLFLVVWQVVAMLNLVPIIFISAPNLVWEAGRRLLFVRGELLNHFYVSGITYVEGMLLAIVVGIGGGLAIGWYRDVRSAAEPFVSALNAIPRVALFPLMVLWLGIGLKSIAAMVFLSSLMPILINTMVGVNQIDPDLLKLARSYGASDRKIFSTIALPSSVPYILAGMRLAAGRGLIGLVVGELWIGQAGLGYLLASAGQRFATDELFVAVLCVASAGMAIISGIRYLERRFQAWRPQPAGY